MQEQNFTEQEIFGLHVAMASVLSNLSYEGSKNYFQEAIGTIIDFKKISDAEFQHLDNLSKKKYIARCSYFYASCSIAKKVCELEFNEASSVGLTVPTKWHCCKGTLSNEGLFYIIERQLKYQSLLQRFDDDVARGIDFSLSTYRHELMLYLPDIQSFQKIEVATLKTFKEEDFLEYTKYYFRYLLGIMLLYYICDAGLTGFQNDSVFKNANWYELCS